jgi:protein SCO1
MLATSRLQRLLLLALVLLLAAIAAVLTNRPGASPAPATAHRSAFDGPTLPPGLRAANFSLQDQNGRRVTLSGYRGHVVVLTFIHSLCHDTCPFMVEQIKGALNLLPGDGRQVPTLGVSVAPDEDTVAHRRHFLARHEMGRLAFLNGSLPAMRAVWRAYAIQPVQGPIDHSTFVLLIDRHGIERVGFPADQLTPEGLAHDIRVLQREA